MGMGNCCECNPNLYRRSEESCCNNLVVDDYMPWNSSIEYFCKLDFLQAYNESPKSSLIY
jgi:hypothetical protein